MSNALAISAVTLTLQQLIETALNEDIPLTTPANVKPSGAVHVTMVPPDKARDKDANGNQINLYLYLTQMNGAWRNQDVPRQARPGEMSQPALALNLYYLITAYSQDNNELISQFMLGRAMRALHDNTLLMPADISNALAASDLHDQIERVRITPQPLTVDEMSKLWMTFQSQYRISSAYEASVVLIESTHRKRAALPVRTPRLYVSTFRRPLLESADPQILLPGDRLTLRGQNLDIAALKVRFGLIEVDPDSATPTEIQVTVPAGVRAGVNTVQVVQELPLGTPVTPHPGAGFSSNVSAFVVRPRITTAAPINGTHGAPLTLSVAPPVGREQRVELFVGDRSIQLPARGIADPSTTSSLTFDLPANLQTGASLLRVQVDGADSPLDVDTNAASATFNQFIGPKVTILMTSATQWQTGNDAYLQAALVWLRLRLAQHAGPVPEAMVARPADRERRRGWFRRPRAPEPDAPPPTREVSAAEVAQAAKDMATASEGDPPPALVILTRRFELSAFEQQVLLLCVGSELDTRIAPLCARARDDASRPYPTFALALSLFDEAAWDALSPERPLRLWRLLEITQPGGQALTTAPLRADERIVSYVKGLNYLDDRLAPLMAPFDDLYDETTGLPPSQQRAVGAIVMRLKQSAATRRVPVVHLVGPDGPSKQLIAQHASGTIGLCLYRLPASVLPASPGEIDTLARLWQRESMLLPIALYVDAHDTATTDGAFTALGRLLTKVGGVVFLDAREVQSGAEWERARTVVVLDVGKPSTSEQHDAWRAALTPIATDSRSPLTTELPSRFAGQFNLSLSTIRQISQMAVADVREQPDIDSRVLADRIWDACLASARPRLDSLADRLDAKATWNDIVLPRESIDLLKQISAQVGQRATVYEAWGFRERMNRGFGISALFAGESGTGKTMAAEVIANDLRLNLYRIDLSAVVNKYIGETEKNLRRVFDAAEDGGAILFFDEADALFGKRSEVKDSHDRYANIEVNYLLQRMESYRGLAILATNMKSALDTAFARRIRFIVNFAFPGQAERRSMWLKAFPASTPVQDLDPDRLARLSLAGGSIHNVALNAAFMAARNGTSVTMPLVLDAARTEFRKLDRPINESDFRALDTMGATS